MEIKDPGRRDLRADTEEHFVRTSSALELADTLEREIRQSDLCVGSPYLSTAAAAQRFHVSTQTANNALRALVKRGILDRRRRKGTFIARRPQDLSSSPIQCVHLLVHDEYLKTEGLLSDGIMLGLQGELPGSRLQFDFIPRIADADFADQVVGEALRSDRKDGFVLVRAPMCVQRLVAASGLPVVVHGSLHPSVTGVPWIERDQKQIGALLGDYLLERGCRRILALFREELGPGDFVAMDELLAGMSRAGLGAADFVLRTLPSDLEAIKYCVDDVLCADPRRTGVFCRNALLAQGATLAAESQGLRPGRNLHLVIADVFRKPGEPAPSVPATTTVTTAVEIGHHIGRMLAQQARGEPVSPSHELIPVQLELRAPNP